MGARPGRPVRQRPTAGARRLGRGPGRHPGLRVIRAAADAPAQLRRGDHHHHCLPVVLMLARAVAEIALPEGNGLRSALDVVGTPLVALLAAVLRGDVHARARLRHEPPADRGIPRRRPARHRLDPADRGCRGRLQADARRRRRRQRHRGHGQGANLSPLLLGWLVAAASGSAPGRPPSRPSPQRGSSRRWPPT